MDRKEEEGRECEGETKEKGRKERGWLGGRRKIE